ncbi:MAG: reverse transcriptase domain-containing protein [Bacilli bacterium]
MAHESAYPLQSEADLRNILDGLYAKSRQAMEQGESPKIKNLLEIAKSEVAIVTAIHNIKSNRGSKTAGTDNEIITDVLQSQYPEVIERVRAMLDCYRPQLLRRKWIEKPGKPDKRPLGIPAISDRVVQEVLRMVIEPIFEAQFFKHSYGFRPLRDAHMALERVADISHNTGYHWVIEGDIRHCFDDINHTKLIKQLWHMGIHDRRVLRIVKEMLKTGVLGELNTTELGTPQGGLCKALHRPPYAKKVTMQSRGRKSLISGHLAVSLLCIINRAKRTQTAVPSYENYKTMPKTSCGESLQSVFRPRSRIFYAK